jgi:hypothetical protein
MKKVIIGISGLAILVLVAVLFVNAQKAPEEVKKAVTEVSKECGGCPSTTTCSMMAAANKTDVIPCDPAKCKEMGCDPAKCKEGKCDPATCKAHSASASESVKSCCPGMAKK